MKKYISALLAILLLLTGCGPGNIQGDKYASVTILSTAGTVTVDRSGNTITARDGMRLVNLDALLTAAVSSSWLTLDEFKAVELGELTGLQVDKQGNGFVLTLTKGEITAQIDKPLNDSESFTVHAGNLTLGVRGTVFTVRLEDDIVTISVKSGIVFVTNAAGDEIAELTIGEARSFYADSTEPVTADTGLVEPPSDGGLFATADTGTQEPEEVKEMKLFLNDLLSAYEAGDYDGFDTRLDSVEFKALSGQIPQYPVINTGSSGGYGIGIYETVTGDIPEYYIYIGNYSGTARGGSGDWILRYASYRYSGSWENDMPNGQGVLYTNTSTTTGALSDGLWDGEILDQPLNADEIPLAGGAAYIKMYRKGVPITFEEPLIIGNMYTESMIFIIDSAGNRIGPAVPEDSEHYHGINGFAGGEIDWDNLPDW